MRSRRDPERGTDRDPDNAPTPALAEEKGDRADRWRDFIFKLAILVLATLWIYSPAYHGDWLWDDDQAITANPVAQGPWNFYKHWIWPDGADYWPLTGTGFWIQWHLFGPNPTGYHVVNIVLHILGALSFWRLLRIMKVPGAWLGGLVFAIHPIAVESVTWVSEFKNTLSLPLLMLAAASYVRFDEKDRESPLTSRRYAVAVGLYLLAMSAKTSMVMFPFVLLIYAWWKRGKIDRSDLVASVPFFAISLILGLMTITFQHGKAIGQETILVGSITSVSGLAQRFALAGMSILHYIWTTIWPFNLLTIYPRWDVEPPKAWQFLPWPIIGAATWWLWTNRGTAASPTWQRHLLFSLGFFVLMLFPILGFITISYMRITWVADHFVYLPMLSLIGFASAAAATVYARMQASERPVALATAAVLLAVLGYSSFRYAHAWAGEETLWPHTIAGHPSPCTYPRCGCWQAHNRLGAKKFARGDVEGAHFHFQNSTRLRPDLGETHNNLGTTLSARAQMLAQRGDQAAAKKEMDEAIFQFAEACRVTPHVPAIHVNLANALAAAGRFSEAADKYQWLLEREPNNPALINNYGVALYKQGLKDESIVQFRRALEIAPNLKDAKESLAVALGEKPDPSAGQQPPGQPPAGQPAPGQPPLEMKLPQSPTLGPTIR
jgi:tetratricopeptide (TPR) repeat protein